MPWVFDRTHSTVAFDNRHLGIAVIKGMFNDLEVDVKFDEADMMRSTISAVIQSASLNTGIKRRDDALIGEPYLDAEHYPTIEFRSTGIKPRGGEHYDLVGDLTLRGTTQSVTFDASFNGQGVDQRDVKRKGFSAMGSIRGADFGITSQLIDGVPIVGPEIKLYMETELIWRD